METFASFDLEANPKMLAAYEQAERVAKRLFWCALFAGLPGNGKTHLAIAAGNAFPGAATFYKVPDLLAEMRRKQFEPGGIEPFIEELRTDTQPALYAEVAGPPVLMREEYEYNRLLILDDLGVENATDWANEQLYRVLDGRYDRRLPTILTTNQAQTRIDDRLRSRYNEGLVVCLGADYRRKHEGGMR
jgi:DNA replication protein DnaC